MKINATNGMYSKGISICDYDWDRTDADVVCKQLGFRGALSSTEGFHFGTVYDKFILNDVNCDEDETDIRDCAHSNSDNYGESEGPRRLRNGSED